MIRTEQPPRGLSLRQRATSYTWSEDWSCRTCLSGIPEGALVSNRHEGSLKRPVVCMFRQARSHRVFAYIIPLFRITVGVAQDVVEKPGLPVRLGDSVIPQRFGERLFYESDCFAQLIAARIYSEEQVDVVGHDDEFAAGNSVATFAFHERCEALENVEILKFDSYIELLMEKALGIVAMGGYNTFCEILTLDKPALIIPRSVPRQEQLIRAERAVKLGLASMLDPAGERDPLKMAAALRALPQQARPSASQIPGLLAGHENIAEMVRQYLEPAEQESITA